MAVKCRMCGEDADLLLKVAYNGELNACCLGEGKAHESGLCWGCDSDGASALPCFDAVYEIQDLRTAKVIWRKGQKWPKAE